MSTASMALLQGDKKSKDTDEAAAKASEEQTTIDLDEATEEQIDDLILEADLEVPSDWDKMTVDAKRAYLEKTYGDESNTDGAEPEAQKEENVSAAKTETKAPPKKAAKGKKKPTGTGVSTEVQVIHEGIVEIPGKDMISDVSHAIENLSEADAKLMVAQLRETTDFNYFKLGGVLSVLQSNAWYAPYSTFKEYVETEHGINYRKAMYLVSIYNGIVEHGIQWDKVKDIGWTKLKEIIPVLDGNNVEKWVKIAKAQTTLQLIDTVKSAQQAAAGTDEQEATSKTVTTKTFKVHEDQLEIVNAAIDQAKEEGNTNIDTVALTYICQSYISGAVASGTTVKATPDNIKEIVAAMELEAILEMVADANPTVNISVEAIE